ncbi:DUF4276 family protein, partial [Candidatus Sumerlaeota bacterium]|nr:DUF4276 family protein [Candidatus Sumerlaeota bacterium]
PSYADSQKIADCYECVGLLESALERDISDPRLIPYIQMHEFEALLFSDPSKFLHQYPGRTNAIKELERIVTATGNPELINDGETTSPSKRIIALIPEYEFRKSSDGPIISSHIGLEVMREKCHHFNEWLTRIEKLSAISPPK